MAASDSGVAKTAVEDLSRALSSWRLWTSLGLMDVRQRNSRSKVGMLWIPILTSIYVACLSFIFSQLNQQSLAEFTIYLAAGYIMWQFMSEVVNDGTNVFSMSSRLMLNSLQPRCLFIFRSMTKNLIILGLNAIVLLGVYLLTATLPSWPILLTLVSVPVVILVTPGVMLLVGLLSLRFPDLKVLIAFAMRLLFFVTPIMWHPDRLGSSGWIGDVNPLYHILEIVRAPLLGNLPSFISVAVSMATGIGCWIAAVLLYKKWYQSIIYWV
jgi:lipopolysaccharide transport system permease protein